MKYKAGVIPYMVIDGKLKMWFMVPSDPKYGGDKPQIAKGMTDKNKLFYETAIKEGEEELGLITTNILKSEYIKEYNHKSYKIHLWGVEVKEDIWNKPHYETKEVVCFGIDDIDKLRDSQIYIVKDFIGEKK